MFLPKWIVALLFTTSIASLSTLLFVFLRNSTTITTNAQPVATIVVASSPESTASTSVVEDEAVAKVASASAIMASDEWKSHTQKELELSVDMPKSWAPVFENNILLLSDPASLEKSVSITRAKKSSSASTLESIKKDRLGQLEKESSIKVSETVGETNVFDYKAISISYTRGSVSTKEIVFLTRNFEYTLLFTPDSEESQMIFNEIIKSIKII